MKEIVTIKIFNFLNDLYMAKAFLESQGIECYVKDEYINLVHPFVASAVNGVKLEVPVQQAEKAVELLIEGGFAKKEDYEIPEGMQRTQKFVEWLKNLFK